MLWGLQCHRTLRRSSAHCYRPRPSGRSNQSGCHRPASGLRLKLSRYLPPPIPVLVPMETHLTGSVAKWPVFICYRQADGRRTAERLYRLLNAARISDPATVAAAGQLPVLDVYYDQAAPGISDWTELHEPYLKRARAMIVVCTPGARIDEGDGDWVHREIDWWIENRAMAPILIDPLGEEERYVPHRILERWPNAQRIRMVDAEWSSLAPEEAERVEERTRARIVGAIHYTGELVYREELEKEKARAKELEEALIVQQRLSDRLRRAVLVSVVLFVAALGAAWIANWQRGIARSRQIDAISRQLAATSQVLLTQSNFQRDRAALLTIEGLRRRSSPQLTQSASLLLSALLKPVHSLADSSAWDAFAVSNDGKLLATAVYSDETLVVAIRDAATWQERGRLRMVAARRTKSPELQFDSTGAKVGILGLQDAWVWSWATEQSPVRLWGLGGQAIDFSRSGRWVAGLGHDGAHVYDLEGEHPRRVIGRGSAARIHHVAFSSLSDEVLMLARSDEPGFVSFIDVRDGTVQKRLFATRADETQDPNAPRAALPGSVSAHTVARAVDAGQIIQTAASGVMAVVEDRFVSASGDDWRVHLWDLSAEPRRVGTVVSANPAEWAVSDDGKYLVGGDEDGFVRVYDMRDGRMLASRDLGERVWNVAISEDGRIVASGHHGDTVLLWDWRSGEILGRATGPGEFSALDLVAGRMLALTYQGQLGAWEMPATVDLDRLSFQGALWDLAVATTGGMAIAWSDAAEAVLWRPATGEVVQRIDMEVDDAQFIDNGNRVVLATRSRLLVLDSARTVLDVALPAEFESSEDAGGRRYTWFKVADGPRGVWPAVTEESAPRSELPARERRSLLRQTSVAQTTYWSATPPAGWASGKSTGTGSTSHVAAIRGDGREVAVSMLDRVVRFNVATGEIVGMAGLGYETDMSTKFRGRGPFETRAEVSSLIYDSEGTLWVRSDEGALWRWAVGRPEPIGRALVLAAAHRSFLVQEGEESVRLYGGAPHRPWPLGEGARVVTLSWDGQYAVLLREVSNSRVEMIGGHNSGVFTLTTVRTETGDTVSSVRHIGALPAQAVFSSDGSRLAVGDQDGLVRVWDTAKQSELARVSAPGPITVLAFASDGKSIMLGSEQAPTRLRVVPLEPADLITALCSRVTRELTDEEWEEHLGGQPRRQSCPRSTTHPAAVSGSLGSSTDSPARQFALGTGHRGALVVASRRGFLEAWLIAKRRPLDPPRAFVFLASHGPLPDQNKKENPAVQDLTLTDGPIVPGCRTTH